MHKIDASQSPLIVMHTYEPIMKADMYAITHAGDELIAKGERFALVIVNDGGDGKEREKGANAVLTQWVKDNKPALQRLCVGMASVVPTSAMLAIYKPLVQKVAGKMYGFPFDMFTDIEQARAWGSGRLN
ncbi:MAG: hypothetical protein KF701_01615 [Anaerolineales bacterium]|nr:MAG: hypothetical protein KF701_01615 [Anaerolineales bacterium]